MLEQYTAYSVSVSVIEILFSSGNPTKWSGWILTFLEDFIWAQSLWPSSYSSFIYSGVGEGLYDFMRNKSAEWSEIPWRVEYTQNTPSVRFRAFDCLFYRIYNTEPCSSGSLPKWVTGLKWPVSVNQRNTRSSAIGLMSPNTDKTGLFHLKSYLC